jgi:hypothetical protein
MWWPPDHPLRAGLPAVLRALDALAAPRAPPRLSSWRGAAPAAPHGSGPARPSLAPGASPAAARRAFAVPAHAARSAAPASSADAARGWLSSVGFAAVAFLAAVAAGGGVALADAAEPVGGLWHFLRGAAPRADARRRPELEPRPASAVAAARS